MTVWPGPISSSPAEGRVDGFTIGAEEGYLDGRLDDLRVYNRVPTAEEIATLAGGSR